MCSPLVALNGLQGEVDPLIESVAGVPASAKRSMQETRGIRSPPSPHSIGTARSAAPAAYVVRKGLRQPPVLRAEAKTRANLPPWGRFDCVYERRNCSSQTNDFQADLLEPEAADFVDQRHEFFEQGHFVGSYDHGRFTRPGAQSGGEASNRDGVVV